MTITKQKALEIFEELCEIMKPVNCWLNFKKEWGEDVSESNWYFSMWTSIRHSDKTEELRKLLDFVDKYNFDFIIEEDEFRIREK